MEGTERSNGIPTRILGRTGVRVTVLGVGGHTSGTIDDADLSVRLVRTAIDKGINSLDNAWCYHGGESEWLMVAWNATKLTRNKDTLVVRYHRILGFAIRLTSFASY